MGYKLKIKNKETGRTIEMDIEDLEYLKELLKEFDETKVDFELRKKQKRKGFKNKIIGDRYEKIFNSIIWL